jgi:hypothetical protein
LNSISSQAELDAAIADAPEGTTWSSNDTSKIDIVDGKPILQKNAKGSLCLTAKLEESSLYVEKSFPVTAVKISDPSENILSDDFSGLEGTELDKVSAENEKGWSSGYTQVNGSLSESEVVSTDFGNMINIKATSPNESTNPIAEFDRTLAKGIDFDEDRTYYITWNQVMDGYGYSGTYKNQRLQLKGESLSVDGNSDNVEISPMFNTLGALTDKNIANNKFDGYYYPARLYIKYGSKNNYSGVGSFIAQKGRMYTFVVRIDASYEGNDNIYIKAYPTGTPALTDWQLDTTAASKVTKITGIADVIGFWAQPLNQDASIMYGDLKIDSISSEDAAKYEAAQTLVANGQKGEAQKAIDELMDGAWKSELVKENENNNELVVGAVTFLQNVTEQLDTGAVDEEGKQISEDKLCNVMTASLVDNSDLTAKLTVTNNSDNNRDCIIIAAAYNADGRMISVGISDNSSISANGKTDYSVALQGNEDTAKVKLFVFDSINGIMPLNGVIELNSNGLIQ